MLALVNVFGSPREALSKFRRLHQQYAISLIGLPIHQDLFRRKKCECNSDLNALLRQHSMTDDSLLLSMCTVLTMIYYVSYRNLRETRITYLASVINYFWSPLLVNTKSYLRTIN